MLAHPKNIKWLCSIRAAAITVITSVGSSRFSLIPQVFVSIRETGLFCSGLGSFSKLGFRAVTSHLLMPSGTTNKSCYSENCSVFEGFYALFVQGGGGYHPPHALIENRRICKNSFTLFVSFGRF